MRTQLSCFLALWLLGAPAFAQQVNFFGTGKPPTFKEEDIDRRFARSKLGKLLSEGTTDPNCGQVLSALFTVLGEVGPTLDKRGPEFTMDAALLQALQTQVTTPAFPGSAYLLAMVRRVQIDRKLPDAWFEVASRVTLPLTVAKLQFLNDGLQPVDSFAFTLEALRAQYEQQVRRATSLGSTSELEFRDKFLDRDVAWGRLALLDVVPEDRPCPKSSDKSKKKGKGAARHLVGGGTYVACLELIPPKEPDDPLQFQGNMMKMLGPKPKPITVLVKAKLAEKQYLDLERLSAGERLMARGRLWEMNKNITELELRDTVLFNDPDLSTGVTLADPNAVAQCPAAINELTGTASGAAQQGGFGRHL